MASLIEKFLSRLKWPLMAGPGAAPLKCPSPSMRPEKGEALRVGYVLWDYPTLSQSFVHSEIKWLIGRGVDVQVYYKGPPDKAAVLDYKVESFLFKDADALLGLVRKNRRHLLHSHFAYPTATRFTWPVAEAAGLPFTVMPHALDIFQYENMKQNRLGEMAQSPCCKAFFAYGPFHRDFFVEQGVPADKVIIKPQSFHSSTTDEGFRISERPIRKVVFVGRFVEKKGLTDLVATAKRLTDLDLSFDVYGYGPVEQEVTKAAEGVPNVRVHIGGLPYEEYMRVVGEADLFFIPCVRARNGDMDGLPTVIMESADCGLPVLTTSLSSIPLLMEDGVTGFVCAPGDIDCFEEKLRWLAGKSPSEFKDILVAARRRVREKCDPDVVNRRLLDTWLS